MSISPYAWEVSIALIVALLLYDYFFHIRKAHIPTLAESTRWSAVYVGVAVLFGVAVFFLGGSQMGTEYFAGYITEKALSLDNVFVFLVIMSEFKVPREDQQKALLIGIVFSLIARTGFIFLGAALIENFSWVFYVFGLILLITAGRLMRPHDARQTSDRTNGPVVRAARALIPTTDFYDGDKLFTVHKGRRMMTPMVLVILALGGTDILFALDSIPAIYGLTENVFIVFTATAFSLLGLRQLYFLIDGLLERLLYLSYGLAAVLGFIGTKLILHALHENSLPFINDGQPVRVIEITTEQSLIAIIGILVVTVIVSLSSPKGKAKTAVTALRQQLAAYLDQHGTMSASERSAAYDRVVAAERRVMALEPRLRRLIREPDQLRARIAEAHALNAAGEEKAPAAS